mmetsp:Transcript_71755/g.181298  ORF Transcript_71755/g.181298 Transcript_71755/m.181298 type:complete len:203 (+) Transcript_71755:216-824(+)
MSGCVTSARRRSTYRSLETVDSEPGRWTLTATSCPVSRTIALYTCAKDAAAMGFSPKLLKTSAMGLFSSNSTMLRASSVEKVSMLSCRRDSSRMVTAGSTSGRIESTCPSLMKVGPSSVRLSTAILARSASSSQRRLLNREKKNLVTKGVDIRRNRLQRSASCSGLLSQKVAMRSTEYTSGRPSSSTAFGSSSPASMACCDT